jgi:alpha-D-ribose 1-methylphosphonate 5-triphosphate synthase subunit PhnG
LIRPVELSNSIDKLTRQAAMPVSAPPKPHRAAADRSAAGRKAALATLVQAQTSEIARGLAAAGEAPAHIELRPVESGLVMLRGRIGGDGAPFNLGEATVTRAAVRTASGEVGFAYVLGRDRHKARLVALCDALWQNEQQRPALERHVLEPIRARLARERAERERETAATRVDFFTLVRGEDG